MVKVFTNEEIAELTDFSEYVDVLEMAYRDFGEGEAATTPRTDCLVPADPPAEIHSMKTMGGGVPRFGLQAMRLDTDLIRWRESGGVLRRETITNAQSDRVRVGKENGLIFVYSTDTSDLVAIMQDGELQRRRVAATNALAVQYLGPNSPRRMGLFGSGFQAESVVRVMDQTFDMDEILVYSPTVENREAFAKRLQDEVDASIEAVPSPQDAAEQVDVIQSITNTVDTVVKDEYVSPGVHVGSVRTVEVAPEVQQRADIVAFHSLTEIEPINVIPPAHQVTGGLKQDIEKGYSSPPDGAIDLIDVIAGSKSVDIDEDAVTVFLNNVGLGVQFVAAAHIILENAEGVDIGTEIPSELFIQDIPQR